MQHCDEVLVKASLIPLIRCCLQNGLSAPLLSDLLGRKSEENLLPAQIRADRCYLPTSYIL